MAEIVSFSKTPEQYEKYAERSFTKHIAAGDMTEQDAQLIREFVLDMRVQNNVSDCRAYKLANGLTNACRFIKTPLMNNTIADINAGVLAIKNGKKICTHNMNQTDKPLSMDVKRDYIIFLKRLYLWAIEAGYCDLPADKINKIKTVPANKASKTAEQMLTPTEVLQIIKAGCIGSTATRDKAMISLLFEGGLRINELAGLQWSDLKFDKNFVRLNVESKTNIPRYIPLTNCREYLTAWRAAYPDGEADGNKPVFLTSTVKVTKNEYGQEIERQITYKTLTYQYTKAHIQKLARTAGIQKHITCHLFRHSRVTNLLQQGFQESTIKMMLWGSLDSKMLSNYAHLCNADTDAAVARAAGIELNESEQETNPLQNRICPRCHTINTPDHDYCKCCGESLTKEAAVELEDARKEIHESDEYKQMYAEMQAKIDKLTTTINALLAAKD